MGDRTSIEWTEATWNPVTGCTKVSPGCDNCYAETLAERFRGTPGHYFEQGFDVQLRPAMLDRPLRWTRPRRIFVCSMADLFHDAVPDEYIARVFAVMALAPQHTFQVLTKRHARMRSLLSPGRLGIEVFAAMVEDAMIELGGADVSLPWPLPNVWLGVSTENQQWADIRIPALLQTPAAVRWISAEPLLGSIDLHPYWTHGTPGWGPEYPEPTSPTGILVQDAVTGPRLDWVVVGGESGHGARPMHPAWARDLRDQCQAADVAFLFKQWGEFLGHAHRVDPWWHRDPDVWVNESNSAAAVEGDPALSQGSWHGVWRVGKKAAGRELDSRTYDGYPAAPA